VVITDLTVVTMEDILSMAATLTGEDFNYVFYGVDEDTRTGSWYDDTILLSPPGFFEDESSHGAAGDEDDASFFTNSSNTSVVDELEDGDMTILYELFWNSDSTLTQLFSAASNTRNPTLTEIT